MVRRIDLRRIPRLNPVVYWALAMLLCAVPLLGQKGGSTSGGTGGGTGGTGGTGGGGARPPAGNAPPPSTGGWSGRGMPTYGPAIDNSQPGVFTPMDPIPQPTVVEDETCLPWDLPDMRGATVSAVRLGVPSKARSEYEKACGAFKKKKMTDAEQHVRDAIEKYPKYLAAYVMLGEV